MIFFVNIGPEIAKSIPNSKTSYTSYLHDAARESVFLAPIEYYEIESIIRKLNNRKVTGPNSIPVNILKFNIDFFSKILTKAANLSFSSGVFPNILKTAEVIPIFKSGSQLDCSNYRPISLISVISKIFEKIMHKRINDFLNRKELIYHRQFGFRPKYSTEYALLDLVEDIKKKIMGTIFAEFL